MLMFVGGIRSGKSSLAQQWAQHAASNCLYVATARPVDRDMQLRIEEHKKKRGENWLCLEEPLDPLGALMSFIEQYPQFRGSIMVDSLGMWLANLLEAQFASQEILGKVAELALWLADCSHPCAVVSEECGLGIMPANRLARIFGDLLGEINQLVGRHATSVIFVTCGLPLVLKGSLPFLGKNA